MKRILILCVCVTFTLSMFTTISVKADVIENPIYIEEYTDSFGVKYKTITNLETELTIVEVYENNVLSYTFEANKGCVFIIDPVTNVKSKILYSEDLRLLPNSFSIERAGSDWILVSSGQLKKLVIDGSVTDLGLSAITGAIIGFCKSASPAGAIVGSVEGVAAYVMTQIIKGKTYSTNVYLNRYYYNGCTWLYGSEFVFPGNRKVFSYKWSDNPSLGIAPYACKLAQNNYPYLLN